MNQWVGGWECEWMNKNVGVVSGGKRKWMGEWRSECEVVK